MTKAEALARLRAREGELRAMGVDHLSIFGSTARDEATSESDLDLAIQLQPGVATGLAFFGLLEDISLLLGGAVDIVTEPTRTARLQAEIDRDRVRVF